MSRQRTVERGQRRKSWVRCRSSLATVIRMKNGALHHLKASRGRTYQMHDKQAGFAHTARISFPLTIRQARPVTWNDAVQERKMAATNALRLSRAMFLRHHVPIVFSNPGPLGTQGRNKNRNRPSSRHGCLEGLFAVDSGHGRVEERGRHQKLGHATLKEVKFRHGAGGELEDEPTVDWLEADVDRHRNMHNRISMRGTAEAHAPPSSWAVHCTPINLA